MERPAHARAPTRTRAPRPRCGRRRSLRRPWPLLYRPRLAPTLGGVRTRAAIVAVCRQPTGDHRGTSTEQARAERGERPAGRGPVDAERVVERPPRARVQLPRQPDDDAKCEKREIHARQAAVGVIVTLSCFASSGSGTVTWTTPSWVVALTAPGSTPDGRAPAADRRSRAT